MSVVTQTSPRTGRFSEAALLIISVGIGVGAFCLAPWERRKADSHRPSP